jgi:hypothetical protein
MNPAKQLSGPEWLFTQAGAMANQAITVKIEQIDKHGPD